MTRALTKRNDDGAGIKEQHVEPARILTKSKNFPGKADKPDLKYMPRVSSCWKNGGTRATQLLMHHERGTWTKASKPLSGSLCSRTSWSHSSFQVISARRFFLTRAPRLMRRLLTASRICLPPSWSSSSLRAHHFATSVGVMFFFSFANCFTAWSNRKYSAAGRLSALLHSPHRFFSLLTVFFRN